MSVAYELQAPRRRRREYYLHIKIYMGRRGYMGSIRGARRRHLVGEEHGTYPVRLRAASRGVLIWARNLKLD
jgi:hypothetical protein